MTGNDEQSKNKLLLQGGTNIKIKHKQAGAELCQAQDQVGFTAEAELILILSSMEAVFYLFKIVSDSTRVDLQMFC